MLRTCKLKDIRIGGGDHTVVNFTHNTTTKTPETLNDIKYCMLREATLVGVRFRQERHSTIARQMNTNFLSRLWSKTLLMQWLSPRHHPAWWALRVTSISLNIPFWGGLWSPSCRLPRCWLKSVITSHLNACMVEKCGKPTPATTTVTKRCSRWGVQGERTRRPETQTSVWSWA